MTFLLFFLNSTRRVYCVFKKLLGMVPRLEERLMECTDDETMRMGELVCVFS